MSSIHDCYMMGDAENLTWNSHLEKMIYRKDK